MAERRYTLIFYGAVIVAALATFGVYRVLQATKASNRIVTQPVVVAAQDVAEGTTLERPMLAIVQWPVGTAPAGAFKSLDSLVTRVARVPIFKGEPIVPGRLAPTGTSAGIEVKITPGKRAMAIRISDVAGVSGLIQPNARVDVLVGITDPRNQKVVAKLFMENMRVLSVGTQVQRGEDGRAIQAATATLEVTPEEAERLAIAAAQGSIQLVLRGYGDPDSVNTRGATSSDVLSAISIGEPPPPAPTVADRPVIRRPAPRPMPAAAIVIPAPPRRNPDSVRVEVYRGSAKSEQKFEKKDSTATRPATQTSPTPPTP